MRRALALALMGTLALPLGTAGPPLPGAPDASSCWTVGGPGPSEEVCVTTQDRSAAVQACAHHEGVAEVCVLGTRATSTFCPPPSTTVVACTTTYFGFATGKSLVPGAAQAIELAFAGSSACSWPGVLPLRITECTATTAASVPFAVAKGACHDTPAAGWRGTATVPLALAATTVATPDLAAHATVCVT